MESRWQQVAGIAAVVGVVVIMLLTYVQVNQPVQAPVVETDSDSMLGPESPTPTAGAETTATPPASDEPSPSPAPNEGDADDDAAADTATPEPTAQTLPADERSAVAVQVVNGGAENGAAGQVTNALLDASFAPREPANAAAPVPETAVLVADSEEPAGMTVADVLGLPDASVTSGSEDNPNWQALGADLDVLVVLGPGVP